jgi:ubiquinone/menaquinone biosynthesis C-methylase UbiE
LLGAVARAGDIADIGCGDGALIYALSRAGRLGELTYAVDRSAERVAAAADLAPGVHGVVADATCTTLPDESVDGVIVSQVIEHLADDSMLAPEIARILRPGGWWYVGSVLRGPRAWWIYKRNGERLLDPTHVREYRSSETFVSVLAHSHLSLVEVQTSPFRFAVTDLAARALVFARIIAPEQVSRLYVGRRFLSSARRVTIRVPGYSLIEATGTKT